MKRCPGDRVLWSVAEGEASHEDRMHIASCDLCTARLRRLETDLHRLMTVLREPPPRQSAPLPAWPTRLPWLAATAGLAAVLMVLWIGLWQQSSVSTLSMESPREPVWLLFKSVATALFASGDGGVIGGSAAPTDLEDLQAALVGDWPCDDRELFGEITCTDDTIALLLGGSER